MTRLLPIFIFLVAAWTCAAQNFKGISYLFPISPGEQNYLAGTVGEIRSTHFHTGIDVKTGGVTGLPIHAAAAGYISRIKVSPTGYGNVLYMQHPNSTYTIYAHLEAFDPQVAAWVKKQQYRKESFKVDLFPVAGQFVFKRGDIIGYSGNSGSSSGPHLHFELRDASNQAINVLSLGFEEIADDQPPIIRKIAFVSLEKNARINGFFGRVEFALRKKEGEFRLPEPMHLEGKVGVEIYAYDPMNGVSNKNGIVETRFQVDGEVIFSELKERFNFQKQRNALVHYNYSARKRGGLRFNRLYLADGNEHTIYTTRGSGYVFSEESEILIETFDSYRNKSTTRIALIHESEKKGPSLRRPERLGNFLHFKSRQQASLMLDEWEPLKPYTIIEDVQYYVWDLREGIPKSLFLDGETQPTDLVGLLPSGQGISYVQQEFEMDLTSRSLFDTLYLGFKKELDTSRNLELFHFKNSVDPIRSSISIKLHPEKKYNPERAAVFSVFGNRYYHQGGEWIGNQIRFKTRDLVTYTILEDSIPPVAELKTITENKVSFRISDQLSGIKTYRARLNGEFLLMHYDPKKQLIWSDRLNKNIPLRGEFTLVVIDNCNNQTTYTKTL